MAYYVFTAIKDIQSPNTLQLGMLLASPAVHFCDLLKYQDSWAGPALGVWTYLPATLPLNSIMCNKPDSDCCTDSTKFLDFLAMF